MLVDRIGYPDGITRNEYKRGEVYDLPPSLAESWLEQGYAEQDKMAEGPSETKATKPRAPRPRSTSSKPKGTKA